MKYYLHQSVNPSNFYISKRPQFSNIINDASIDFVKDVI